MQIRSYEIAFFETPAFGDCVINTTLPVMFTTVRSDWYVFDSLQSRHGQRVHFWVVIIARPDDGQPVQGIWLSQMHNPTARNKYCSYDVSRSERSFGIMWSIRKAINRTLGRYIERFVKSETLTVYMYRLTTSGPWNTYLKKLFT